MKLQYYVDYLSSWFYHNVVYTDTTFAIIKIFIIIGLISLLVYNEYAWFILLCIVILSAQCYHYVNEVNLDMNTIDKLISSISTIPKTQIVEKDELTNGIAIQREGFSIGMPKIIHGDDSGKDHRRYNKFVEEDSNDFTDKYFKSKQCSIGTGIGGMTMFGSNELIGDTKRTTVISGIYNFEGKLIEIPNKSTNDVAINTKRYEYFRDCVYEPVFRSENKGSRGFREIKTKIFKDINNNIINISRCMSRFNTEILFNTNSDINANISKRVSLSDSTTTTSLSHGNGDRYDFVSLIKGIGGTNDNAGKLKSIQPLKNDDNLNDQTYSQLLSSINSSETYKNNDALKQRHLTIYNIAYKYRKRIDEILSMMKSQTKDDAALLYSIRVSEPIIQELRMILSYLMIIQRTNDIITFEMTYPAPPNGGKVGIYDGRLNLTPKPTLLTYLPTSGTTVDNIRGTNSILNIPTENDTYNTVDEKRYLYGITYYFL